MSQHESGRSIRFAALPGRIDKADEQLNLRMYDALAFAYDELAAAVDLEQLLKTALMLLCRTLKQPYGRMRLSTPSDRASTPQVILYRSDDNRSSAQRPPSLPPGIERQPAGRPSIFSNVAQHRALRQRQAIREPASLVLVPVVADGRVQAVFEAYGPVRHFDVGLLRPLELFAGTVGCLIGVQRLQGETAGLGRALQQARLHLDTITGITSLMADQRIDSVPSRLFSVRSQVLLADHLDAAGVAQLRQELAELAGGLELLYRIIRRVQELPVNVPESGHEKVPEAAL
jgi:hypothetical protein